MLAAGVVNVQVPVLLDGNRMTRTKIFRVTDPETQKEELMEMRMRFWQNATVTDVSDERNSEVHGPYRSVTVAIRPGEIGYVIGYETRDALARLQPGAKYNLEGNESYGKSGSPILTCRSIVKGRLTADVVDDK